MKNTKAIKVAPGNYLHFCKQSKNLSVTILVHEYVSPKYTFFGPRSKPDPQPDTASYLNSNARWICSNTSLRLRPSVVGQWGPPSLATTKSASELPTICLDLFVLYCLTWLDKLPCCFYEVAEKKAKHITMLYLTPLNPLSIRPVGSKVGSIEAEGCSPPQDLERSRP